MSQQHQQHHLHHYNPNHTHLNEAATVAWLQLRDLTRLDCIPGIGPKSMERIIECTKNCDIPINTGYALLGLFISMKRESDTVFDHVDRFYQWLQTTVEVHGNCHQITKSVAEKVNISFDGLYSDVLATSSMTPTQLKFYEADNKTVGKGTKAKA